MDMNLAGNAVTSAGITPAYFDSPDRRTTELLLAVTNWNVQGRPGAHRVFTTPKEFLAPFESGAPRLFDFKQRLSTGASRSGTKIKARVF